MLRRSAPAHGFTLVELMVTITLIGVVVMVGAPSFGTWIQNVRLRSASESILTGLQLAKSEAVSRNARVRFQLTTTLDDTCALSTTSPTWVVNLDPDADADAVVGNCDAPASDTDAPRILHKPEGATYPPGMTVDSNVSSVAFNGLGRPVTAMPDGSVSIDIAKPGDCVASGGTLRCLRVVVSSQGQVRLCDPKFEAPDPQGC
jgi:type IV fimbrial biogenesis protein FimT